jgi:hypothetical protein
MCVRIDTDDQRLGVRSCQAHDGLTITSAQIYDCSLVAGNQLVDLADVNLSQGFANTQAHGGQS